MLLSVQACKDAPLLDPEHVSRRSNGVLIHINNELVFACLGSIACGKQCK